MMAYQAEQALKQPTEKKAEGLIGIQTNATGTDSGE